MKLQSYTFPKCGLLVALFALLGNLALAQRTVMGKVTDAGNGEALIGATVSVVGTPRGGVTDIDGKYSITVPNGATQLRFSYTGYTEQTVALGAGNTVDVAMLAGTKLDEVVVVGYGSLKAKEVTSAISTLQSRDFNKGAINDPVQLIQGKIAGVAIARPGNDPNAKFQFRIRGLSSLGGSNEPLIVIDGVPGLSFGSVDVNDIETFDVLKDGSAAAIYGTRASNGVIIITTKKGGQGKAGITYEVKGSLEHIYNHAQVMNASEYVGIGGQNLGSNTDWFSQVTRDAFSHTHGLSFNGGNAQSGYRVGLNYRDVQGISLNDGYKWYNARVAFNQKALNNRLTITSNVNLNSADLNFATVEAFRYAAIFNPTAPIYADPSSADYGTFGGYYQKTSFDYFNPVAIANQSTSDGLGNNISGNVHGDLDLGAGFSVGSTFSLSRSSFRGGEYYSINAYFRGAANTGKRGSARTFANTDWDRLFNSTLSWKHDFGSIGLNALVGYEEQEFNNESLFNEAAGFTTDAFGYNNLSGASDFKAGLATANSYREGSQLQSVFGRVYLKLAENINFMASLRQDGSSRFGPDNRRHLFPGASISVDMAKYLGSASVNSLKLRVGYGETGALPGSPYLSKGLINPSGQNFFYNNGWIPAYVQTSNINKDLGWESKKEYNVGVDFAFSDYHFSGSLDYFNRNISNFLYTLGVPLPSNIAPNTLKNTGELKVTGLELLLNYQAIDTKDMGLNINFTAATAATEMVDIFGAASRRLAINLGAPGLNNLNLFNLEAGKPVGQLIGPVYSGIDDQGKYIFVDQNGDGKIDQNDEVVIGNGLPKLNAGLGATLNVGSWDFNVQFRGVFGHDLLNEYRIFYESREPGSIQGYNRVNTKLAVEGLKEAPKVSSLYVEKGDFVRLDNLTLGYTFKMAENAWFTKCRAYFTGNNLVTFTGYTGVDPEVRYGDPGGADNGGRPAGGSNPLAPGIDRRSTYFATRTFTVGVQVGF